MRNSLMLVLFLTLSLIVGMVGCEKKFLPEGTPVAHLIETRIPAFEDMSATATYRESYFPIIVRCEDVRLDVVRPGAIWRNIQIGESTYDEMISKLEINNIEVFVTWIEQFGFLRISNTSKSIGQYWSNLDVCFVGDVLVTLQLTSTIEEEFPRDLSNIIRKFGTPDVVTWGNSYYTRSLIWMDLGMLIVIDVEYDENTGVLLFPPIAEAEFEESWLFNILPKEGKEYDYASDDLLDVGPLPRRKEREDPWGFTDWWRIFD